MSTVPDLPRISDYLDHWARVKPEQDALVLGATRWTYRDLASQVDRLSKALLANGVGRGDRVAVMGTPRPECFAVLLAASRFGAITLGLNPKFPIRELRYFVDDAEPRILLGFVRDAEGDHCAVLDELARESTSLDRVVKLGDGEGAITWDELVAEGVNVDTDALTEASRGVGPREAALLVYTSGSTGRPKGAVLPGGGLAFCSRVQAERWNVDPARLLVNLPVNHIGFMGDMCSYALVAGGTAFFMESFDPAGILQLIERERLTGWGQVPTMFQITLAQPEYEKADLSSLQTIIWGGAHAPEPLLEALAKTGARLATSFGMTETTGSVTYTDADASMDELAHTVGKPDPHYEVRIAGPDGVPVEPGEEGEIQVRGDHIMIEYWRRPEATAAAIDSHGWLHTEDVALLRPDGTYAIRGRLSGMYKSGGENVYPREVENVLEAHPGVALAAVFGVPDPVYAEVGRAYVIRQPGEDPSEEELRAFCRERLVNFKVPKTVHVRDVLPMLPIGKVDKVALRDETVFPSSLAIKK
ncbi:MAG: AMP-binding protein [Myxococcota bacterium]|jgi:acyl-CoA synthetase (AMP-forming)/AMP-acid ligase II|nr:AMP-binding protein [Myxococcota bacterium]